MHARSYLASALSRRYFYMHTHACMYVSNSVCNHICNILQLAASSSCFAKVRQPVETIHHILWCFSFEISRFWAYETPPVDRWQPGINQQVKQKTTIQCQPCIESYYSTSRCYVQAMLLKRRLRWPKLTSGEPSCFYIVSIQTWAFSTSMLVKLG